MSNWDETSKHRRSRAEFRKDCLDSNYRRADRELSKAEMQAQLADAVRNTAKISINEGQGS